MHAELLTLPVINVDSSLPLADVAMQPLQSANSIYCFCPQIFNSCQATLRCYSSSSHGSGMELGLDVESLGVGLEQPLTIPGRSDFSFGIGTEPSCAGLLGT